MNAFRTNMSDIRILSVGLNTNTSAAGLKSGAVTVDNLDVTGTAGSGQGAGDGNDTINMSLTVLDHAQPSFTSPALGNSLNYNFGNIAIGDTSPAFSFDVFNLNTTAGFTANMDFDNVFASGDSSAFTTNLAASAGSLSIAGGSSQAFMSMLSLAAVGNFSATYTLNFSDENIAGALSKSLTLMLSGTVRLAGDYNSDNVVDAADYTVWRHQYGNSATAYSGADGDGDGTVGDNDLAVWRAHFGDVAPSGFGLGQVPEPAAILVTVIGLSLFSAICHRVR